MLSVVITAWNEAKNLPRVITSVKNLADEIVVVDNQSTDDTASIAKKFGCRVFTHPKAGIVEKVRNFSIKKASGDWILLLDADEEIQSDLIGYIKKIISENQVDYCRIARKNIIFNKWITSDHWWPDYVYRLFKKNALTWQETIHSIPITTGVGFDFPMQENLSILHHNYQTISQYVDRLNRYTDFQSQELFAVNTRFSWTDLIKKPVQEFLTQYFARKGYTSGVHGLALSLLQGFSQLIVYLKLWENLNFRENDVDLNLLKNEITSSTGQFNWWYWQTKISTSKGLNKFLHKLRRRFSI